MLRLRRFLILLDGIVDFLTVDRNVLRSIDAEPNLVSSDFNHRDPDFVPDDDCLVRLSRQDEHGFKSKDVDLFIIVRSGRAYEQPQIR